MVKYLLVIIIFFSLAACSSNVSEVNNDKPASTSAETSKPERMVVVKPDPLYDYMNKDSGTPNNDKYCAELSQKIQKLKGKPLRQNVVQKRYEAECKNSDLLLGD